LSSLDLKIGAHKVKLTQPLFSMIYLYQEKLEDTRVIRSCKSKTDNTMTKRKRTKGHTKIYKTLHKIGK